jgi:hypothetical protein
MKIESLGLENVDNDMIPNGIGGGVYLIQHYVIKFVTDRSVVSSRQSGFLHQYKIGHHVITEIFYKENMFQFTQKKTVRKVNCYYIGCMLNLRPAASY